MTSRLYKIMAFLLVLLPGVAFSAGEVEFFTATYTGSSIRLDWKLSQKAQSTFEVYRKRSEESSYSKLGDVDYNGSDSYTYVDDNLYRTQGVAQVAFSYKLVVHQGGQTQNYLVSVEHGPTAVQRSWGSIKMMFR